MRFLENYCRLDYESEADFRENFKVTAPEKFNYGFDVVDVLGQKEPNKTALVWCNDKGEERFFSFKEISELSAKAANAFARLGVKRGDKVILILKRRYQFWYSIIALHKLGATVIPATNLLTSKDIAYRIDAADAKMVLCTGAQVDDDEVINHVNEGVAKCERPDEIIKACVRGQREGFADFDALVEEASPVFGREDWDANYSPELISLMYFTSGTTGHPKMVAHDFNYPLGHIATGAFWHHLNPSDLHFTMSETGWGKAVWGKLYGQWMSEASVFVYDFEHRFPPLEVAKMIEKYHITTFCAPPTVYRFMIQEDLTGIDLSSLRASYVAGEPLNPEVYNRWYEITGLKMREGFGQTETPVAIFTTPWMEPKPGSMGRPTPGFGIELLDDEGKPCEIGVEGEICVNIKNGKPNGLFLGYYKAEEATNRVRHDGYYHTGDQAWMDEDGYLWFVGRADDVIKSSGYRIGPFEVESALLEHPAVVETAITAVPDPVRGQIVKATVVLAEGYVGSKELIKELQDHVKRVTAPYKYPRIIEFVKELPKTISGKIRRVQIREEDQEKK